MRCDPHQILWVGPHAISRSAIDLILYDLDSLQIHVRRTLLTLEDLDSVVLGTAKEKKLAENPVTAQGSKSLLAG